MSIGCGFNTVYPVDNAGSCQRTNVNHQALAMAQVMNYYQHPNKGWRTEYYISNYGEMFGNFEHYYNWDSLNLSELLFDCDRYRFSDILPVIKEGGVKIKDVEMVEVS
jgi:hypothetical protein